MTTRRALTLTSLKGEDNLEIRHVPIPDVGDNDVLINVKFCGLNFAECSLRQGLYSPIPPLPTVPGYECSGVIGQIGSQVTDLKVGDRVVGLKNFGAWSDVVVLPSSDCNVIPDNMSLEDAAAIPVNYLTSYLMLFDQAALKPGDKVFVHMAAGGVGTAVGQLCRTVPDVTVIGTASKAKHKHCLANGIHHPIDYKSLDFVEETRKLFPKGVDIMLDPVGGPTSKKSHTLLRSLGKHIHYGGSSYISGANKTWTSMFSIMWNYFNSGSYSGFGLMERSVLVGGLHVGKMMQDPEYHPVTRRAMTNLLNMYKEEKIKPHIDSVWHFEQIKEAMGRIYSGQNVGKVILNASVMSEKGTPATKK